MGAPLARARNGCRSCCSSTRRRPAPARWWKRRRCRAPGFTALKQLVPVGVVGGIIPWNGPLMGMWWIYGPALATGCTAVLKPAEDASLSSLRVSELMMEAGVPDGVINVVTGYGRTSVRRSPSTRTSIAWHSLGRSAPRRRLCARRPAT